METRKRRVISLLVDNQSGVLARVSSLFCRRGFNIDSLTVSATNDPAVSRSVLQLKRKKTTRSGLSLKRFVHDCFECIPVKFHPMRALQNVRSPKKM